MDSMPPPSSSIEQDPRVYLAAERTLLAWVRTGIALMGLGFVIARFGLFLREMVMHAGGPSPDGFSKSLLIGLVLLMAGITLCIFASLRHARMIRALDEGSFRKSFDSRMAYALVALLVIAGIGMMLVLLWL